MKKVHTSTILEWRLSRSTEARSSSKPIILTSPMYRRDDPEVDAHGQLIPRLANTEVIPDQLNLQDFQWE
eukprot:scaffold9098_cov17-Tisochrysis_lutea.AAC.1